MQKNTSVGVQCAISSRIPHTVDGNTLNAQRASVWRNWHYHVGHGQASHSTFASSARICEAEFLLNRGSRVVHIWKGCVARTAERTDMWAQMANQLHP
eukprot:6489570-Amphidinium_carterae.1